MSQIKRSVSIIVVTALPIYLWAQTFTTFIADRPGATTGVDVLPKGRIQWETGLEIEHSDIDFPSSTIWTINTSLLRVGISNYAELRLGIDYLYTKSIIEKYSGISGLSVGSKLHLYDGGKVIPQMSLLASLYIPGNSESFYLPQNVGGQLGLLFQNELSSRIDLGYEADFIWLDSDKPIFSWGVCLGLELSNKINLMVEEYNFSFDQTTSWIEVGAALMLSKSPNRYFNGFQFESF